MRKTIPLIGCAGLILWVKYSVVIMLLLAGMSFERYLFVHRGP